MVVYVAFFSGMVAATFIIYLVYLIWNKKNLKEIEAVRQQIMKPATSVLAEAQSQLAQIKSLNRNVLTQAQGQWDEVRSLTRQAQTEIRKFRKQASELPRALDSLIRHSEQIMNLKVGLTKTSDDLAQSLDHFTSFSRTVEEIHEKGLEVFPGRKLPSDLKDKIILVFPGRTTFEKFSDWLRNL